MKDGDIFYYDDKVGIRTNGKTVYISGAEQQRVWDWLVNLGKELEKILKKEAKA